MENIQIPIEMLSFLEISKVKMGYVSNRASFDAHEYAKMFFENKPPICRAYYI